MATFLGSFRGRSGEEVYNYKGKKLYLIKSQSVLIPISRGDWGGGWMGGGGGLRQKDEFTV